MGEEFPTLRKDVVRRTFIHLRQTGHLPVILAVLTTHAELLQRKLDFTIEHVDVASLGEVRKFGKLQGRLAETKRLIRVYEAWSKEDFRARDDDGELVD